MRIIFFTDHFFPEISAPASHIFDRCKIWVKKGHNVTVVTNIPNYPFGKSYEGYKNVFRSTEIIEGIKVLRVGTYMTENRGAIKRSLDYLSYCLSSFINSLTLQKPDIVISTTPHIFIPLAGIAFSKIKGVPHVLEVRDLWPESIVANTSMSRESFGYKVLERLEKLLYKQSENIIVFTQSFKENIQSRGIDNQKLHVVINGANLELFSDIKSEPTFARSNNLENKFVVSYMGTFGLSHNLSNAIEAAGIVKSDDIHFLFLGDGAEKKKIKDLATKIGADNVHFFDPVQRKELPKYWAMTDVGLVHLKNDPTFSSVIPSKIFETMAVGVPIVYSGPISEGSKLIEEHKSGLIAKPDSPKDLARKIIYLKNNVDEYLELANNGKHASKKYSRDIQAESAIKVLERTMKNSSSK